jgi:hypothetical protein
MKSINGRPTIINIDDVGKTRRGIRRPAAHFADLAVLAACAAAVLVVTASEDLALWINQPRSAPVTLATMSPPTATVSCSLQVFSSLPTAPSGRASAQPSAGGS